jgi:predicted TIM-barrel fold metal-dependent hydrolase
MIALNGGGAFDVHHHVGSLASFAGQGSTRAMTAQDDVATRLRYMDAHGIAQCLLLPAEYPAAGAEGGLTPVNDAVARYCSMAPDRFPAMLAAVDQRDTGQALEEIDRCVEVHGVRGFVWHHHFLGTFLDDPRMRPLIARIHEHGLPVFVHLMASSFLESPWRLQSLADEFSETTFVALDGFSSVNQAQWMGYIAEKHPKILFDTGMATSVSHGFVEFIDRVGAERLLFGSDFYSQPTFFTIPAMLYELVNSPIAPEDLRKVLGDNARRVLGVPALADGIVT